MELKLLKLTINNFKGIKNFELKINGKSAVVTGKNGTGKTTLADAWFWLFDDADLNMQSKFNVIQLDDNGIPIDHQNAVVEAEIIVDEKPVKLRKIYLQKWTKKRGSPQAEFTGHKTDYFWNDVPVSKKEYNNRLSKIIDPGIFRTLSDPSFFCGKAGVDFRRDILLRLVGYPSDMDICAQYPELSELLDHLMQDRDRSIEDHRKIMQERRRDLNKELDRLPERIDELKRSYPDTSGMDEAALRDDLAKTEADIDAIKNEMIALTSGLAAVELKKQIAELDGRIAVVAPPADEKLDRLKADLGKNKHALADLEHIKKTKSDEIAANKAAREKLMAEWHSENNKKYVASETCEACGQALPPEQITKQRYDFNAKKASKLKEIDGIGKELFGQYDELKSDVARVEKKIEDAGFLIVQLDEQIRQKERKIDAAVNDERKSLVKRQAELKEQLAELDKDIAPERKRLENRLSERLDEKSKIVYQLLEFTRSEKVDRRIAELEKMLKKDSIEFEETERQLILIDLFMTKKGEFIEENVSQHFETVRWKLFETQVNQGVRDICEATVGGVPYSSDLNTGARIIAGLDCIKTLSKHYGVYLPVFIDNAESVTNWPFELENQMIKLVAAANIDELGVINK